MHALEHTHTYQKNSNDDGNAHEDRQAFRYYDAVSNNGHVLDETVAVRDGDGREKSDKR